MFPLSLIKFTRCHYWREGRGKGGKEGEEGGGERGEGGKGGGGGF